MIIGDVGCSPGTFPAGSQLAEAVSFLQSHPGTVAFITIDIGANDILGLYGCHDPSTLLPNAACVDANMPTVQAHVATILQALVAAAPGVPIIGMDYYNAFLGAWVLFGQPGQAIAQAYAPVVETVNAALRETYLAQGAQVADVSGAFENNNFAEMVETKRFGRVPVNVANVCQWTWFCEKPPHDLDIHANSEGYGVIAAEFAAALVH
jgi:lysophospholipase L1-like esterase